MNKLIHCPTCHDKSVITKIYTRKDNTTTRALYCINKGCDFKQRLCLPKEIN